MVRSLTMSDFSLLRLVDDLTLQFSDNPGVQMRAVTSTTCSAAAHRRSETGFWAASAARQ